MQPLVHHGKHGHEVSTGPTSQLHLSDHTRGCSGSLPQEHNVQHGEAQQAALIRD